jgi:hypothetical protein
MTIQMISLAAHLYAGQRLQAGDKFTCRGESDARLLRALGRAINYTPPPPVEYKPPVKTVARKYFTAAVLADEPAAKSPSEALMDMLPSQLVPGVGEHEPAGFAEGGIKPKRAYRRRDMKADE